MVATAFQTEIEFTEIEFCGNRVQLDASGCLYWPEERLLVVSDLHLEKGSSFAAKRGLFVPPYDTSATLENLAFRIGYWDPKVVISLGDSFHDQEAYGRLSENSRQRLNQLMAGREWVWVYGNHDPCPVAEMGGTFCQILQIGSLNFLHEPLVEFQQGEIAGHLHPSAKIRKRGKSVRRRCFVGDQSRIILPAFGAFTGGLNIRDHAYDGLFSQQDLRVWMLSKDNLFAISAKDCIR